MGAIISILTLSALVVVTIWVVLEKRQPTSTLAWLLAILTLPYVGLLLYLVLGRRRINRKTRNKALNREAVARQLPETTDEAQQHYDSLPVMRSYETQEELVEFAITHNPLTVGNQVCTLVDGDETFAALFHAIKAAKKYILVEYYIVQPDSVGLALRDALVAKAKEGVAVHFLYDGVGSWKLSGSWLAPLHAVGVESACFLPLKFSWFPFRMRWNFRNHRKIVIIDGAKGFTGGLNIGEEYQGANPKIGYWRDTHLELIGPSVRYLEQIFHEDWFFATGKTIEVEPLGHQDLHGDELVQILPSGPDREWQNIHLQIFVAITTAKERCYITTPYFVPDEALRTALVSAALRGVDVRLLVPSRSDLKLVLWAGRSYYGELLRAGVRIFEYQKGFLHAKSLVVDGLSGTVGSANMDIRSFRLNFEVNAFVYSPRFAKRLEEVFERDLEDAKELALSTYHQRSASKKFVEALARMTSPLL